MRIAPVHRQVACGQAVALYDRGGDNGPTVRVAGRIVVFRRMGRAAFVKILDREGQIQLYFTRDELGEEDR